MTSDRASARESISRSSRGSFRGSRLGKSRQSMQTGKGMSKTDNPGGGPTVRDPEDGTIRTPKCLLTPGTVQMPAKQLAGIMSTLNDETASVAAASDIGDAWRLGSLPSIGGLSAVGSAASVSDAGEEPMPQREAFPVMHKGSDGPERASAVTEAPAPVVVFDEPLVLTRQDLDALHMVLLQETETVVLLDKPALVVNTESEEGADVDAENKRYEELLRAKVGNDAFTSVSAQTADNMMVLRKQKEVQTDNAATAESAAQWETDTAPEAAPEDEDALIGAAMMPQPTMAAGNPALANAVGALSENVRGSTLSSGAAGQDIRGTMNEMASARTSVGVGEAVQHTLAAIMSAVNNAEQAEAPQVDPLMDLEGLSEALGTMESCVTHSVLADEMLLYRGMQPLAAMLGDWTLRERAPIPAPSEGMRAPESELGGTAESATGRESLPSEAGTETQPLRSATAPSAETAHVFTPTATCAAATAPADTLSPTRMQLLWQWSCDLTEGRNVSCMAWNHERHDLLAVGYGSFDFERQQGGLVCLWSMRNPSYPLWWFELESGVLALDFSKETGGVLAVGTYKGNVAVYDVKGRSAEPLVTSDASPGKHLDPVWKVRWVEAGAPASTLVSVSTDGRVTRWDTAKGLEFDDLMKLKRTARREAQAGPLKASSAARGLKTEAFISRLTAGTAIDVSAHDERVYIAGTEDGWIHRCSTSYSEQYMMSYRGHMGPVYNVQWCPFQQSLFISCSADWTVRLWLTDRDTPLLTLQNSSDEVHDVQWCPSNSTVFATASGGGSVEVWDLAVSTLKPVATFSKPGVRMTSVLFNEHNSTIVAGDSAGGVSVLRLFGIALEADGEEGQKARLAAAMDANVIKTVRAEAADAGAKASA